MKKSMCCKSDMIYLGKNAIKSPITQTIGDMFNYCCSKCGKCEWSTEKEKSDHKLHPTQKPLLLMNALIELTTLPGQVVLDPFMGSGSTCLAAKSLNRQYIGFELDKNYFDIAQNRIKKE